MLQQEAKIKPVHPLILIFLLMRRLHKITNPEVIYSDFNLKKMNVLRIFLLVRKIWITYLFSHYFVHYTNWLITGLHFVSNVIDIEVEEKSRTREEVEEHVCCLYSVSNGFINLRKPGGGSFNRVNGPKLRIRPRKYPTAFGLGLHRFRISLRSLSLQRMLLRTLKASVGLKSAWKEEWCHFGRRRRSKIHL